MEVVFDQSFIYILQLYLATDLKKIQRTPEPEEFIKVIKMPFRKAFKTVMKEVETPIHTKLGMLLAKEKLKL